MCDFVPGQRVVCINDGPLEGHHNKAGIEFLTLWQVYTIRGIAELYPGDVGVWLDEIRLPTYRVIDHGLVEYQYSAVRFRPIKKTDITVFTKMLKKLENV